MDKILPLIEHGHLDFGENKVQEAIDKWSDVKLNNNDIQLHLIGGLQTNKVKLAVKLFDYIHSVDTEKLAIKISDEQKKQKKRIKIFIQVNIGNELQKSGIPFNEVDSFYTYCSKEKNMNIVGLMSIPPNDNNTETYFKSLSELNYSLGLKELSIGMSADYLKALKYKSTFLRIGTSIFGKRD